MSRTSVAASLARMSESFETYAASARWYHAMRIGDVVTRGRFPEGVQNRTLLGVFDLLKGVDVSGLDCLDIGAMDGITSFGLKALGAESVTATDRYRRDNFEKARAALDLDVAYAPGLEISGMVEHFGTRRFDLIVCAGVIYHMLNPFTAFQVCRQIIKPGGLLIIESACAPDETAPVLALNSETQQFNEVFTYWVPSPAAIEGMMRLGGFSVLDRRRQRALRRHAVIARAASCDEIADRTDMLKAMQAAGYVDMTFSSKTWADDANAGGPSYTPAPEREHITTAVEPSIEFPFHPGVLSDAPVVGARHEWVKLPA